MIAKTLNELSKAVAVESRYKKVDLHDFSYSDSKNQIMLDNNSLSDTASKQILGIAHTDRRFADRISKADSSVWKVIYNQLKELYNIPLSVKVDSQSQIVEGLFNSNHGHLTNKQFVTTIEEIMKEVEGSEFSHAEIYDNYIAVYLSPDKEVDFGNGSKDLFKAGQVIANSSVLMGQPTVADSLRRLECSNMMYVTARSHVHRLATLNSDATSLSEGLRVRALSGLNNAGLSEFYKDRIINMRSVDLSLGEVDAYSKALRVYRTIENDLLITDIDIHLPVGRIRTAYGLTDEDSVTSKWMMTARTPINAYEIFDYITRIATHNESLNSRERLDLQILSGRMLFRDWDGHNIAPKIVFANFK